MVYETGLIITTICCYILISYIVPFFGPVRRKVLEILTEPKPWEADEPYVLYHTIESGLTSSNINGMLYKWFIYQICTIPFSLLAGLIWPFLIPSIIFVIFFRKG